MATPADSFSLHFTSKIGGANEGLAWKLEEPNQMAIAGKVSLAEWQNDVVTIVWVVRWTNKGLMPIRPQVHLRAEAVLPTGRALELHQS